MAEPPALVEGAAATPSGADAKPWSTDLNRTRQHGFKRCGRSYAIMRRIAALALSLLAMVAHPAAAQTIVYEEVIEEEYFVEAGSERFVEAHAAPAPKGIASYGPFRVIDARTAALVGVTDATAPFRFADMLRAHPGIAMLQLIECPGTEDDRANLRLGRMIRDAGIATHVPAGGSVRSGAVELFLAGARRTADPGAEFAVHAWMDDTGREATDYAASAPENAKYLAYYQAMGMSPAEARAFYAMTNSVRHTDAKWLDTAELQRWVRMDPATIVQPGV